MVTEITYPISMPSTPGFRDLKWQPKSSVSYQQSPFTLDSKKYVWSGQKRWATIELPPMTLAQAKEWQAWAYSLNGIEGTFYFTDSVGKAHQGAAILTGLINGAGQTGQLLNSDAWDISTTDLFKAADWISLNDRLYTVLLDVDSDISGHATFNLWPKIRTAYADNLEIKYGINARGIFELTEWPEMGWDINRLMSGFSFTVREAF